MTRRGTGHRTHGESASAKGGATREYRAWAHMRDRCLNPTDAAWPYYGGRGIRVCARWATFELFLADMGRCPDGMSLDRVDTLGHYEPTNCRWATKLQQGANQRRCRYRTLNDERISTAQMAQHLALPTNTLRSWLSTAEKSD
jgi:hypothetical protein